jgi:hypothetical protein
VTRCGMISGPASDLNYTDKLIRNSHVTLLSPSLFPHPFRPVSKHFQPLFLQSKFMFSIRQCVCQWFCTVHSRKRCPLTTSGSPTIFIPQRPEQVFAFCTRFAPLVLFEIVDRSTGIKFSLFHLRNPPPAIIEQFHVKKKLSQSAVVFVDFFNLFVVHSFDECVFSTFDKSSIQLLNEVCPYFVKNIIE